MGTTCFTKERKKSCKNSVILAVLDWCGAKNHTWTGWLSSRKTVLDVSHTEEALRQKSQLTGRKVPPKRIPQRTSSVQKVVGQTGWNMTMKVGQDEGSKLSVIPVGTHCWVSEWSAKQTNDLHQESRGGGGVHLYSRPGWKKGDRADSTFEESQVQMFQIFYESVARSVVLFLWSSVGAASETTLLSRDDANKAVAWVVLDSTANSIKGLFNGLQTEGPPGLPGRLEIPLANNNGHQQILTRN